MKKIKIMFLLLLGVYAIVSCRKDEEVVNANSQVITTPFSMNVPDGFSSLPASASLMTVEAVRLGRYLFYDSSLSEDYTISCASCHKQKFAFSDNGNTFSKGVHGRLGNRNAMALFNLAWDNGPFFWDGRAKTLEDQAGMPVINPDEMNMNWDVVVNRLKANAIYQDMFARAFGRNSITEANATKAIAEFIRTIVSSGSKYDRFLAALDTNVFTPLERRGYHLYFDDPTIVDGVRVKYSGVDCGHCHATPTATPEQVLVNQGKRLMGDGVGTQPMKTPSLRNLQYTAPYMHDGSMPDLDAVLDHYSRMTFKDKNQDPNMFAIRFKRGAVATQMNLDNDERAALKAFLMTMSDPDLLTNPAYSNPFVK